ncbi:MAG: hypothetical protein AAGI03_00600 [Pseudomonadota bacterium]
MTFTTKDKLAAVEREIAQRERVYPRLIARGQISQKFADLQIALMKAIAADYRAQAEAERLI